MKYNKNTRRQLFKKLGLDVGNFPMPQIDLTAPFEPEETVDPAQLPMQSADTVSLYTLIDQVAEQLAEEFVKGIENQFPEEF